MNKNTELYYCVLKDVEKGDKHLQKIVCKKQDAFDFILKDLQTSKSLAFLTNEEYSKYSEILHSLKNIFCTENSNFEIKFDNCTINILDNCIWFSTNDEVVIEYCVLPFDTDVLDSNIRLSIVS